MHSKNRAIADIGLSRSIEGATGTDGASGIEMNMLKCVGVQWMRKTHTQKHLIHLLWGCRSMQLYKSL